MGLFDHLKEEARKVADKVSEKAAASGIDVDKLKAQATELTHKASAQAAELTQKATDQVNAYTRTARSVPASEGVQPPSPPPSPAPSAAAAPAPPVENVAADSPPPPPPPPAPGSTEQGEGLDVEALKAKAQQLLGQAKGRAVQAREVMLEKTDAAAVSVAKKVSEKTGREVTPSQVKKVALAAGIALAAVGAIDLIADAVMEGGVAEGGAEFAGGGAELAGEAATGSGDVMDEAGRFFAENGGSLNIEHVAVDIDGCEI